MLAATLLPRKLLAHLAGPAASASSSRRPHAAAAHHRHSTAAHAAGSSGSGAAKPCVRICTGKVCRKQGSAQVLKFGQDLGLDADVVIEGCGCLGNCGAGPNLALLPAGQLLRHVATPADLAHVLSWQLGLAVPPQLLTATQLRLAGNSAAGAGDLKRAVALYLEALQLNAGRGQHLLHSNLSAALLQLGDKPAALEHAQQAVALAPPGFHTAHIRLVDSLYSLGRFREAGQALGAAAAADASFRQLPEYRLAARALRDQGVTAA